jgi:hypothetical protein
MDLTINWLTELWSTFSLWTSTQPTFVQVAFGMGLLYRFVYISVSGLFVGRGRPKVKRDFKPPNRAKKDVIMDDDAPPFLFR